MKKWTATLANFFLPGLGYIIAGQRRVIGVAWLLGAIGLTYVEFGIQQPLPQLYWVMFASVFVMNTAFAIDVFREVSRAEGQPARI
ncbi:MAG: hypothetical protein H6713_07145 [Myxococcales bacterium]|nr:hypothetical protein [Myxococcales bacterium]MCB9749766.1 hypothetical protein [Myxococcales bacterium]